MARDPRSDDLDADPFGMDDEQLAALERRLEARRRGEPVGPHPDAPAGVGGQPTRPNTDAFLKAGAVSLAILVVLGSIAYAVNDDGPEALGYVFGRTLAAYLIVAIIARLRRRHWGWGRYIGWTLLTNLVLVLINVAGSQG